MAIPSFLKVKDESVYYSGKGELIIFVPELFFDRGIATIDGEFIELIGILNYAVLDAGEQLTLSKIRNFYFPARFMTSPGRIEKVKNFTVSKNFTADYRLFHYTNNDSDQVIVSTKIPQDIDDVEDFFRVFVDYGHIPNTISYLEMYKYYLDSIEITGNNYGLAYTNFGFLISEQCRDPEDPNKPFRLGTAIDKDPYSYKPMSVMNIPKVVSPFQSISSVNFDRAVIGAVMNKNNAVSPMERVLMG